MLDFTPGPWEVCDGDDGELEVRASSVEEPQLVAVLPINAYDYLEDWDEDGFGSTTMNANARLIAAAPEIADSLKEIVNSLETVNDFNSSLFGGMGGPLRVHPKLIDRAKALLRRIEGEEVYK